MTPRIELLEAVAEAALFVERCVNAGVFDAQEGADAFDGMQAALRRLDALDALPPAQPAGETVEVRAAVFSNGGDGWTVYGASDTSDKTVIANAMDALCLEDSDESHVGWINTTLAIPKRTLPEWHATVEPTP